MPLSPSPTASPPSSDLHEALARFLSHAVACSLHIGLRTPDDFLRHFTPADIMGALATDPERRAELLERTTGMKRSLAIHKDPSAAADDLRLGLEHGQADPAIVVDLVDPDVMVQHLAPQRIWRFVVEDKFWLMDRSQPQDFELAQRFVGFLLTTALSEALITPTELVMRITPERLALCLPRQALAPLLTLAFAGDEDGPRLDGDALLAIAPPVMLAQHVPLAHLWRTVFVERISRAHDLAPIDEGSTGESTVRHRSAAAHPTAAGSGPYREADVDIDGVLDNLSSMSDLPDIPAVSPRSPGSPSQSKTRAAKTSRALVK